MREQDHRCCYCMRRITPDEVSVEHLVPESNDDEEAEFEYYCRLAPYIAKHVMSGHRFDALASAGGVEIDTHTLMPHLIAHANLFPACTSQKPGCSCNNHRGNARILPMMLMEDVDKWLTYGPTGELKLFHTDIEMSARTLEALDINTSTLREIRRLWYGLSRTEIRPTPEEDYNLAAKDKIIRSALGLNDTDIISESYIKYIHPAETYYWNLFLKYDWFWTYYRTHFPL